MNKICTSLEQSKKLIELGIDVYTADMYWKNGVSDKYIQCFTPFVCGDYQDGLDFDYDIPAWSLTALLEMIPNKISINNEYYYLSFEKNIIGFRGPITWDGQKSKSFEADNLIDAAFEMVCWLLDNKKL